METFKLTLLKKAFFVTRLTRLVPLVVQELPTLPENLSSLPVFSGVRVARSLVLCVCAIDRCLFFVLFHLAIVLSILLRFTDSDYSFGIFKLFFNQVICNGRYFTWLISTFQ
jgi:hypothetical protein